MNVSYRSDIFVVLQAPGRYIVSASGESRKSRFVDRAQRVKYKIRFELDTRPAVFIIATIAYLVRGISPVTPERTCAVLWFTLMQIIVASLMPMGNPHVFYSIPFTCIQIKNHTDIYQQIYYIIDVGSKDTKKYVFRHMYAEDFRIFMLYVSFYS